MFVVKLILLTHKIGGPFAGTRLEYVFRICLTYLLSSVRLDLVEPVENLKKEDDRHVIKNV